MSRPLVLYHANCADGFCAAWVAWRLLQSQADYVPVQYGLEPPDVAGRDVCILDFSYDRTVMEEIIAQARQVVLLDHHKTAEEELRELSSPKATICFDQKHSGGWMAWCWFIPHMWPTWLVGYTEDRDLWRWALPDSRAVSAWLASVPWTFEAWDDYARIQTDSEKWKAIVREGEAILRYQDRQVERLCKQATEVPIGGHKVLAVNTSTNISEVAEKLAEGRPFGAAWFVRADGKRVWSLRSTPKGIDVSEVARAFGGGGHRNAAGFEEG